MIEFDATSAFRAKILFSSTFPYLNFAISSRISRIASWLLKEKFTCPGVDYPVGVVRCSEKQVSGGCDNCP